ncbi:MAG: methionyl-tRNA formyltransferase, partial [Candidatus Adiutrix sp.]
MTDNNTPPPYRLVFFGSGPFSLPALESLAQGPDKVVLVVTAPPAPAGRGKKLMPTPTAQLATQLGFDILEARSLRPAPIIERIAHTKPDLLVVAAYGAFLPPELLRLCPTPPLNIHPSLLPKHRGPAPINWALINGDSHLGVSIIFLDEKMDSGPILSQRIFSNTEGQSATWWESHLAQVGAMELMQTIENIKNKTISPQPQNHTLATINPLLKKSDGQINWHKSAPAVASLINGTNPWPGAQSRLKGKSIKFFNALAPQTQAQSINSSPAGQILG